jgi:hypothetical protein
LRSYDSLHCPGSDIELKKTTQMPPMSKQRETCFLDDVLLRNSHPLASPREDCGESYMDEDSIDNFLESFEVVVDEKFSKIRVFHRTVRLKEDDDSDDEDEDDDDDDVSRSGGDKFEPNMSPSKINGGETEENDDHDDSIIDTLLFGCVGCEPCVSGLVPRSEVRSILKSAKYGGGNTKDRKNASLKSVSMTRNVSFSSIDIKEFKMTLGDHPSAVSGPPIRIDWSSKPTIESVVSLDEFEQIRKPLRRKRKQLKLTNHQRKEILLNQQGFTQDEINKAWVEAQQIRQQRYETLNRGVTSYQINMDHLMESFHRKCDRIAKTTALPTVSLSLTW